MTDRLTRANPNRRMHPPLAGPLQIRRAGLRDYQGNMLGVGVRTNPGGTPRDHHGVDLLTGLGANVFAIGDGVVTFAGWMNGYGNVVILRLAASSDEAAAANLQQMLTGRVPANPRPLFVFYAHLASTAVHVNARVAGGERIGTAGVSGRQNPNDVHLHIEVRDIPDLLPRIGHVLDPLRFMAGPQALCSRGPGPAPVATPTPTATPSPSPSASPTPTPTPSPSPTPAPSPTPGPSITHG